MGDISQNLDCDEIQCARSLGDFFFNPRLDHISGNNCPIFMTFFYMSILGNLVLYFTMLNPMEKYFLPIRGGEI